MTYIKKLVMSGFKSFARKTEIPFGKTMNVVIGPNGSGKSNITDALCFVLGRLSIKSMRAAKASHLLFSGNSKYKPVSEAYVELIFDNSDKTFSIDSSELVIRRILKKNGQSIYKINNETKTRQELLEILAQGGIDPNGFNIVLQGEIESLVRAGGEERRKIIEEVAGISIYETRKQKSLRELEKIQEKLREAYAVLKERKAYLKNLERERQDALEHQKLQKTITNCKATLFKISIKEKEKEIWGINKVIESYESEILKLKKQIEQKQEDLHELEEKIALVNKQIQSATTDEQEIIHRELSNLKAELAGLSVRKENYENRKEIASRQIAEIREQIKNLEKEISQIKTTKPEIKKQQQTLKKLREKLDALEEKRKKYYSLKSQYANLESQRQEKQKLVIEQEKESQITEQEIHRTLQEIKHAKHLFQIDSLKEETKRKIQKIQDKIITLQNKTLNNEKENAVLEKEIQKEEEYKKQISNFETCPFCKQKITKDHLKELFSEIDEKIKNLSQKIKSNEEEKIKNTSETEKLENELLVLKRKSHELELEELKLKNVEEKQKIVKRLSEEIKENKKILQQLSAKIAKTQKEISELNGIEDEYDEVRLRFQELNFFGQDIDSELATKTKELGRLQNEIKSKTRDIEESTEELEKINTIIEEKKALAKKREKEEQELYEKFQKFFTQRNELQDKLKLIETEIIGIQHTIRNTNDKINYNKIQKAQLNAQIDSIKTELLQLGKYEEIRAPVEKIKEKLQNAQFRISRLGNINMRALEVYEKVEEQVKAIQEKIDKILEEEQEIRKIIEEIDRKKKRTFVKTLEAINKLFERNFSHLSRKGQAFLEPENKQDPFEGGINILIKVAKGKYFSTSSLSGGEKTLVALALIFAIQEYKPYTFYIFDEIEAALDKRNSELLAALIKKYMTTGQYIIITHNDALISEAEHLYGVSMQEGISKIVSLKL